MNKTKRFELTLVDCLAKRTQTVRDKNPDDPFGSFNDTFVPFMKILSAENNCLAFDIQTQMIISNNCLDKLSYICQKCMIFFILINLIFIKDTFF